MSKDYTYKRFKMTYGNLHKAFDSIGWSLHDHGCNHWYLYNPKGEPTSIMIYGDPPYALEFTEYVFKGNWLGTGHFGLNNCYLDVGDKCVSFIAKRNKSIFVNFYPDESLSPHPKEKEEDNE